LDRLWVGDDHFSAIEVVGAEEDWKIKQYIKVVTAAGIYTYKAYAYTHGLS
jgi:hypothetical protein